MQPGRFVPPISTFERLSTSSLLLMAYKVSITPLSGITVQLINRKPISWLRRKDLSTSKINMSYNAQGELILSFMNRVLS